MTQPTDIQITDRELIARSLLDPESFGELFTRHYAQIHRFIRRRIGSEKADDIASETFMRAFHSRAKFDETIENAAPWLFGIAANALRSHARAEVRMYRALSRVSGEEVEDFAPGAIERTYADSQSAPLFAALANLDKRDRDVVLLHVWAELSLVEVATALAVPDGTVRSRLARARKQLARAIDDAPREAILKTPATEV